MWASQRRAGGGHQGGRRRWRDERLTDRFLAGQALFPLEAQRDAYDHDLVLFDDADEENDGDDFR